MTSLRSRLYRLQRGAVRTGRRLRRTGLTPRHSTPFATHIPPLIAVGAAVQPRRALELGTGTFSTPALLDPMVFPDLEVLDSVENDEDWARRTSAAIGNHPRSNVVVLRDSVSSSVTRLVRPDHDLIFIDDSKSQNERVSTIQAVLAVCSPDAVVVIHDFEVRAYQRAARAFPNQFVFSSLNPRTGVVWKSRAIDKRYFRRINRLIRRQVSQTPPSDYRAWSAIIGHSDQPR